MIESGSSFVGVDPSTWQVPAATAFRIELPAPDLCELFSDYYVMDSDAQVHADAVSCALPAWPMIRIIVSAGPTALRLGPRCYDPLPAAALYGTSTRAMQTTAHGGVTVGVGLTPLGWSRLFALSADQVRDRVVPLADLIPAPPSSRWSRICARPI